MTTKLHLNKTVLLQVFLCIAFFGFTSNNAVFAQFINNGDFSAGIATNWENRDADGITTYTDESGAIQAVVSGTPTAWYTTGIVNDKKDNTISAGETVKVTFKAETSVNATVRVAISNGTVSFKADVNLTAGGGLKEYTVEIPNTGGTSSDYRFNLFFLNAGTFKIDDIEMSILNLGNNLALTATVDNEWDTPQPGLNDGNTAEWTGWNQGALLDGAPVDRWLELTWASAQTLNRVVVFTIENPDYTLTDYTVQYWDGAAYVTLGSVSNNIALASTVTFDAISTTKIKVICTGTGAGNSYRIQEIETYNETGTALSVDDIATIEDNFFVYTKPNTIVVTAKESIEQLQIYSLLGVEVYSKKNLGRNGTYNIASDAFSKGIYVVRINSQYVKKIIVQ